jgi:hypothetical protein
MSDIGGIVNVLLFMGGFMAIVVGVNYAFRWTNRHFPSDSKVAQDLAAMEQRLAELEERVDFTERVLSDKRGRDQLPPKA